MRRKAYFHRQGLNLVNSLQPIRDIEEFTAGTSTDLENDKLKYLPIFP